MNFIKNLLPWKRTLIISLAILILLDILSFYGLYTNKFYFFRIENFVFPILSLVHIVFLYVLWFKITEDEYSDPQMRNLEYALYFIAAIYLYKVIDTIIILSSYGDFEGHLIPGTFFPTGIFMLLLYIILIGLTFLAIKYRKELVGTYVFDDMNRHVDGWK